MKLGSMLSFMAGAVIGAAAVAVYLSGENSEEVRRSINDIKEKAKQKVADVVADNVSGAVQTAADTVEAAIDAVKGD